MPFTISEQTSPIAELPDNATVNLLPSDVSEEGEFLYDTEEQYREALREYVDDQVALESYVRHEGQHVSVALAVGVVTTKYGLAIDEEGALSRVFASSVGGSIPKLAYAAIFAAPINPSTFDMKDILILGYKGVGDIAERAIDWNRKKKGIFIPVPLSYRI